MPLPGQLNPSPRLLLGPGPSDVHPARPDRHGHAAARPSRSAVPGDHERDAGDAAAGLPARKNALTFPVSGTGMAGMETCVVNLIEPGDKMVVCVNGFFGQRMVDVASRAGAAGHRRSSGPGARSSTWTRSARCCKRCGPRCWASSTPRPRPAPGSRSRSSASCATSSTRCCCSTPSRRWAACRWSSTPGSIDAVYSWYAEGPELPARPVAGVVQPARRRGDQPPQDEGAELVSRHDDGAALLGRGALLPPHGADHDDLRPARGAAAGARGRAGSALATGTCATTRRSRPA